MSDEADWNPFRYCTAECAVAVSCPVCGNALPPRGRSVAPETNLSQCCYGHRYDAENTRHVWSIEELEEN